MFGRIGALLAYRRNLRLAWRLLKDRRVPLGSKMVVPAAVLYLLFPVDLLPDFFPALGQMDDLTVLLLSVALFLRLAPDQLVREHLARLSGQAPRPPEPPEGEVIDGRYTILK